MAKHYKVVLFYARAHQPTFNTKLEAERFIQSRALTRKAAYYTELWEMKNEEDGEQLSLFDYGHIPPQELVLK